MSENKTYVFGSDGSNGSNLLAMLSPLLQQRGIDPSVLAMMSRGGCYGDTGAFIWIIFLFFLMGWNRNGFGGYGDSGLPIANAVNNSTGRELIMSAIQGNATSISQLATTLNCDVNAIQSAIAGVQNTIQGVGNQVGLTSQQVINSIQQGNMSIAQQLCSCCSDMKQLVTSQGYENQLATLNQTNQLQNSIENVRQATTSGFANIGYATQDQTCQVKQSINDGIQRVIDGQNAAITRELQNKINAQSEELSVYKSNAATSAIVAQALAPITAALSGLTNDVNAIKCKQPETVTLPYSCATAVPTTMVYGAYGFNGAGAWG